MDPEILSCICAMQVHIRRLRAAVVCLGSVLLFVVACGAVTSGILTTREIRLSGAGQDPVVLSAPAMQKIISRQDSRFRRSGRKTLSTQKFTIRQSETSQVGVGYITFCMLGTQNTKGGHPCFMRFTVIKGHGSKWDVATEHGEGAWEVKLTDKSNISVTVKYIEEHAGEGQLDQMIIAGQSENISVEGFYN